LADSSSVILTCPNTGIIADNVISGNIIKINSNSACDAIQLSNTPDTVFLANNIISNNIIDSPCVATHGAIDVRVNNSCVSYNNVIANNNLTLRAVNDVDSAIFIYNAGGFIIKDNNIEIVGNAGSGIDVYGIYSVSTAAYLGEIVNNRILCFASNGANMNIAGVKITTGSGILQIEGNKMDASLSDALTYAIVSNTNANAISKKNLNDLRVPSSGVVTIAIAAQTAVLPVGNFELEGIT